MNKAAEIDSCDEGELLLANEAERKKRGFKSKRELRIAIDSKKPSKDAPAYLRFANDRMISRDRSTPAGDGARVATAILIPMKSVAQRPVKFIDVDEGPKENE